MAASKVSSDGSKDNRPLLGQDLLHESFVNEDHMQAFEHALTQNDYLADTGDNTPLTPRTPKQGNGKLPSRPGSGIFGAGGDENGHGQGGRTGEKVEMVQALSDFAPIHQRVSRRKTPPSLRQGWSFHLARWPLLGLIFFIIALEFGLYVLTRQIVNGWEWLVAWRGHKRTLRKKLRSAKSWEEWRGAALDMDKYLGFEEWKETDEDPNFDYPLVRKVRRSLMQLRASDDVRGLMGVLEICLRSNFAGTESVRIYSETFYGTKKLVESYIAEVETSLAHVRLSPLISLEEKRRFYRSINKNYGSSALCLSGGASFGYYHFGVVRAFLDADLLPRVITGTSAGGLVAALTCTRTDEELRELLVPELADRITACEESVKTWSLRFWKTGARFDTVMWARKATFFTRGSLTFREAYERTGRALNVSVIPHDRHSPTKLLNYLTAPDCVIWSAIIASAAVPGIINSVVLMQKMKDGELKPMNWGSKFKDGSLRVDIPLQSLHLLFNVNHSIVSQVNPHVHLFFFAPRGAVGRPVAHRKGRGWRGGFLLSASEQYLKLELTKNFKVIRDLELLPTMLGQDWSSVFLQKFEGSVTIWPRTRLWDWFRLLTDPDRTELARMIKVGQLVAWPKLHMIENRFKIERSVLRGRLEVRQAMNRQRTSNDTQSGAATPTTIKSIHIPLESDVERGFAARARNRKRAAHNSLPSGSATPIKDVEEYAKTSSGSPGVRRRKARVESHTPSAAEVASRRRMKYAQALLEQADSASEHEVGDHHEDLRAAEELARSPPQSYSTLGSSFTRLRTRSVPGLPPSFFPSFLSRRSDPALETHHESPAEVSSPPAAEPDRETASLHASSRTPSRITKWFNPNVIDSDSSTSDDEVYTRSGEVGQDKAEGGELSGKRGSGSGGSGGVSEEAVEDDEDDEDSSGEGEVGATGERVSLADIEHGAAEGEITHRKRD